ncbi:MAG: transporter [Deltaproteobacteria bacterium]|nr:transporter [Deltaproteobacteria bacterium]
MLHNLQSRVMNCRVIPLLCRVATTTLILVAIHSSALSVEGGQSRYFKGYRDFLTGVLPAPGLLLRHDLYVYSGTERSTIPQGQLSVGLKAVSNILSVAYVTPYQILGGNYAFAVRGAVSDVDADQTLVSPRPRPTITRSGNVTALNDIAVNPFIVGWHSGYLHWNVAASVWLPAGNYDKNRLANTGRNVWGLSPQFAATYFDPKSGWEVSGAAIYVISSKNTDTNYRSGDTAHFDFAVGKMLSPQFKLGVVGYYAQQVGADSGTGAIFGDRKLRVAGLGPGATFTFSVNNVAVNLVAKYYREFDAQNTTQGDAGTLSVRVKF